MQEGVIISPLFCDIISSEALLEKMDQDVTPCLVTRFQSVHPMSDFCTIYQHMR